VKLRGIASKVWLSIGIFALGYLISIGTGQVQAYATEGRLRKTAEALFPIAQQTQEAAESFHRMVRSFNDAVMTEDEAKIASAAREAEQTARALRASAGLAGVAPERQQMIESLAASLEKVGSQGRSVYGSMLRSKGDMTSELQQSSRELAGLVDRTGQGLKQLADQTAQDLQHELQSLEQGSGLQRNLNLGLLAATLLISMYFVNRMIQRSVVGPVARVIQGVEVAAGEAAQASDQVAKSGNLVADSANQQASYLHETASSLDQIASMTRSNATRAGEADRVMGNVRSEVEAATVIMHQLTGAIKDISVASRQVAGILKTIDEIAFHTNILALNAAVEAARAGEAGAGFSVVADEVRSLAHRSSEAARDVALLIEGTLAKVDSGSEMVTRSSSAFETIAEAIVGGSRLVTEIAQASETQRSGIEQISAAVTKMNEVTQTNAAMAQDTASAAETMSHQVQTTRNYIGELADVVGVAPA